MRRLRRCTALLMNLVLLQLALGGPAGACHEHGTSSVAGHAMAGHAMPGHAMAGSPHDAGAPDAGQPPCHDQQGHGRRGGIPCQMPASSGSCASMASCTPPMLIARVASTPLPLAHPGVPTSIASRAAGPSSAPELPPPRA